MAVISLLCGVFNYSFAYTNAGTIDKHLEANKIAPALIGIKLKSCFGLITCLW